MLRSMRAVAVALMTAGSVTTSGVAEAAPPPNDDITDATVIDALPFSDTVDTTEATTSADEAALNALCGAPAMEQGVWYTATPQSDGYGVFDTTGSSYPTGILVLAGSPGSWVPLACGPGSVIGPRTAGVTLYFMVFGYTQPSSGTLVVEVRDVVAPPVIDVSVDPVASVDRFGAATITGTVTCTAPDGQGVVFEVDGSVRQRVGRGFVDANFFVPLGIPCDGTTVPWSALAVPDGGKFAGGKAATVAFSFGCGTDQCSGGFVESTVQMKKGRMT